MRIYCALATVIACGGSSTPVESPTQSEPTAEEAQAFVERVEAELAEYREYAWRIAWVRATNITFDTNWLSERVDAESTKLFVGWANEAKRFNDLELPADVRRRIELIKQGLTLPAPSREGAAEELAAITTRLDSTYSTGKIDLDGSQVPLDELQVIMAMERDAGRLEEIWTKWRDVVPSMRSDFVRMVELANEGAVELGYRDVRELWLSKYDMSADEMETEVDRLWSQVKPLYDQLHCYVRGRLNAHYGDETVPLDQPLRADIMGNMWAQSWSNLRSQVTPEGEGAGYDLTEILVARETTPRQMVETGERFFTSLGLEELPDTFWERSLFTRPRDREVVCHASAWDVDDVADLRIKMCIRINARDFQTIHHELGHNYYQRAYNQQSPLFREGAHDGFHEAIGDFIALSVTPEYLVQIGLLTEEQLPPPEADIGLLLAAALDKVAFLPFGLLIDKWRWDVFSGAVPADRLNARWWELRRQYQGVRPPNERSEEHFDPGAKYHIAANVPYLRYFLANIMQFQFHQAACEMNGWEGPLHRCSIYGARQVGERFNRMMSHGVSQPWPDTLEAFTGTRTMDGSAIVAYFAPLMEWLAEQNEGQTCGW